jgi:hypothetical protein
MRMHMRFVVVATQHLTHTRYEPTSKQHAKQLYPNLDTLRVDVELENDFEFPSPFIHST